MTEPFENAAVAVDTLPDIETVDWQPLASRYLTEVIISRAFFIALIAGGLTVASLAGKAPALSIGKAVAALAALFVLQVAHAVIAVPKKGYALRQHDMLFKTGWIFCSVTAVPLNRIQHVELGRGPLERALGLAKLQLFTAGGSGSDLALPGLSVDTGERLREFILGRINTEDDAID
ncbi:MAG: PH domain-containing protein [Pseudomonadota bacterium]